MSPNRKSIGEVRDKNELKVLLQPNTANIFQQPNY